MVGCRLLVDELGHKGTFSGLHRIANDAYWPRTSSSSSSSSGRGAFTRLIWLHFISPRHLSYPVVGRYHDKMVATPWLPPRRRNGRFTRSAVAATNHSSAPSSDEMRSVEVSAGEVRWEERCKRSLRRQLETHAAATVPCCLQVYGLRRSQYEHVLIIVWHWSIRLNFLTTSRSLPLHYIYFVWNYVFCIAENKISIYYNIANCIIRLLYKHYKSTFYLLT